jgi:outer membrane usher protein
MSFPLGYGHALERLLFHQLLLVGGCVGFLFAMKNALASTPMEFQSGFMRQNPGQSWDAGALALKSLATGQELGPGSYWVDIKVNAYSFGQRQLTFDLTPDADRLQPCLSAELVRQFGVRLERIAEPSVLTASCVDLTELIPEARIDFEGSKLLLSISIPQIAMQRETSYPADPARWDYGINAAFINYQVSAQQGSSRYGNRNSSDLYVNSGVNLGPWRLRSSQTLRQDADSRHQWDRAYSYAQRDLPGMRANLTLGETFTGGEIFRSVPIKGAMIGSDMGMLSDAQQGYAPIIRGVAQTRAKLEIFQNGYPVYSTYVSPGPYEIDDLNTAGGSGELEIVLTEADGQVRRFSQPYAAIGNLLREGVWRHSSAFGRYNAAGNHTEEPLFWQSTLALGTGGGATVYGGLMASEFYRGASLGIAKDLGSIGAFAFEATHSSAKIDNGAVQTVAGMSYAVKYGKAFTSTTNLRFAGYRYSMQGYRDFDEAVRQRSDLSSYQASRRGRLETSIHQRLSSRSSLSLTLSHQDYWQSHRTQRQFQLNFNTHHRGVTYNFYASQALADKRARDDSDPQLGLSISVPLDFGRPVNATFDIQNNGDRYSQRASLAASAYENLFNYQATLSRDDDRWQSSSLSVGYQAPYGNLGAGVTHSSNYRNLSLNASGAVLLHADGVEFGPYLGETSGLVEVRDIPNIGVMNATGVKTNNRGFALVPQLRPYRTNQVVLETDHLGPEIEIDNGSLQVIPRRGAVVKASFSARAVVRLVVTGRTTVGDPLPFGAQVSDASGKVIGVVAQAGQVLLATSAQPQTLDVSWGTQSEPRCQLIVKPDSMQQSKGYRMQDLTCQ